MGNLTQKSSFGEKENFCGNPEVLRQKTRGLAGILSKGLVTKFINTQTGVNEEAGSEEHRLSPRVPLLTVHSGPTGSRQGGKLVVQGEESGNPSWQKGAQAVLSHQCSGAGMLPALFMARTLYCKPSPVFYCCPSSD